MNRPSLPLPTPRSTPLRAAAFVSCVLLICSTLHARTLCDRIRAQPDVWVDAKVDALVRAAAAAYRSDRAQPVYERVLDGISGKLRQCKLASDGPFVNRYHEFVDYVITLALARQSDHELGFSVPDKQYFAETRQYVEIPAFLLTPRFLRAVTRLETLSQAKAMLRQLNANRSAADQLLFFSYKSRHLGTPDNPDSFWRLLIVVPGNEPQQVPEKWVQFGVRDARTRGAVRNVSVVSVVPAPNGATNVYFKDYYRTYRRDGSITIKGRWELGEGDDNCAGCHKSGVLPIFPVSGSVSRDELPTVGMVNERFLSYLPSRFDEYLDASKLGPGLGTTNRADLRRSFRTPMNGMSIAAANTCGACHQPTRLGALNWPMDQTLIESYVKGAQMPLGYELPKLQRVELYQKLIEDYFAIDDANPGILKAWLLGKSR